MFFEEPYSIFTISALILLSIAILEAISVATMGSSMDSVIQGSDGVDVDADIGVGLHDDLSMDVFATSESHAGFETGVNLLNIGKVPFMIVLAALATWFTISGYTIHFSAEALGLSFSNYFVAPISFGIATIGTFFTTKIISKIIPPEKSSSIKEKDLIGSIGSVVLGQGDDTRSVQIRTTDQFGEEHYMQARVALPGITIKAGDEVIILKKGKDSFYKVLPKIPNSVKSETKQSVKEFLDDNKDLLVKAKG